MADDTDSTQPKALQRKKVLFTAERPTEFVEWSDDDFDAEPTPEQLDVLHRVGKAVAAYIRAAKTLLDGRLSHLRDAAPVYLREPGTVLVTTCEDGVVVRYERDTGAGVRPLGAWMPGNVRTVARLLSQGLIQCRLSHEEPAPPQTSGAAVTLTLGAATSTLHVSYDVVLGVFGTEAPAPAKPFCLVNLRNEVIFQAHGEVLDAEGNPRPFICLSSLRLPFGWECIELFPLGDLDRWNADVAAQWAETDILSALVASQLREQHISQLDPHAAARRDYSALLTEFQILLDRNPEREEELQSFLTRHPELLCPTKLRTWPKLALGPHRTDYVFREAAGEYLLVEIERSTLLLFKADGHQTAELTHAHGQIHDWKRYIADNLQTVRSELGLSGISSNPRSLIVMGRSASLTESNRRRIATIQNESPTLQIWTCDDVLANARAAIENFLGPLWNVTGNTRIIYP